MDRLRTLIAVTALLWALPAVADEDYDAARRAVTKKLIDPGSADFRNFRRVRANFVCGEVNAKNRMGGYDGFKVFAWHPKDDQAIVYGGSTITTDPLDSVAVNRLCI